MSKWLKRKFDNFIRKHTGWVIAEDCFIVIRGKLEIENRAKFNMGHSSIVLHKAGTPSDNVYSELDRWLKGEPNE